MVEVAVVEVNSSASVVTVEVLDQSPESLDILIDPPFASVDVSPVGVQGPKGQDGGSEAIVSAVALGANRAVTYLGEYCDPIASSLSGYAGVTLSAVSAGQIVLVQKSGSLEDASWSWSEGAVYVGSSGVLTQVQTSSALRRIGWSSSPTTINLDPMPIIEGTM